MNSGVHMTSWAFALLSARPPIAITHSPGCMFVTDLLDEALARSPVHNPEWTNFNRSDPGVTLIEVFAWMTDQLLYRLNRVPERHYLKFLEMIGVRLEPPREPHSRRDKPRHHHVRT